MVGSCVAYDCTNSVKTTPGVTFHKFPKDAEVRTLWECAVRREGCKAKDGDRLCSVHFTPERFDRTGQTTRLRPGTVPAVFPAFPERLQAPIKRKRPPPKSRDPPCSEDVKIWQHLMMMKRLLYLRLARNEWFKDRLHASEEETVHLKKKIKILKQTKRRLQKRNETDLEIIRTIKERKLLSDEGAEVFGAAFSSAWVLAKTFIC
ncbi:THAP domain-containing protein 1-like [Amblyomma americanum]